MNSRLSSFESMLLRSWQSPSALSVVLWPLSQCYRVAYLLNRFVYEWGIKRRYVAPVPVVVVGNLTVGGAGKSPCVAAITKALGARGLRVGIISRGYHRDNERQVVMVDSQSASTNVGDEPLMLFEQTGVPIAVCATRKLAIEALLANHTLDVIVSDDGLQHWPLLPKFKVCIDDESVVQNNRLLLPAGPYREPYRRLQSMDYVLIHSLESQLDDAKHHFYLEPGNPTRVSEPQLDREPQLDQGPRPFPAGPFNLVAGIGKPERFFKTVQKLGLDGVEHPFSDHHVFTEQDFDFANDYPVLMTEKDAVKCRRLKTRDLWYLPVIAKLPSDLVDAIIVKLKLQR